jgi:asparagine synthase (glutamine-hydrolysing)
VRRWIVGAFGGFGADGCARLARALVPETASVVRRGALRVAHTGPPSSARDPLCVLDGHLDNVAELSATLDTPPELSIEQLLAVGWRRWSDGLLPRLRGDFALLLWDRDREEGLLARDQLGARSLFLCETPGGDLLFAGEIRYLLALLARRPAPDRVGLAHWLATSTRPGSATLYEGIRRLNPGSALHLTRDGASERAYWTPRFRQPLDGSSTDLAELVGDALECAVRRRTSRVEPTGVLMSGGLDSASVAAVAAGSAPGRVAAYSAVFPEHAAVDESALVAELRGRLALPGVTAEVRPGGLLQSGLDSIAAWQLPLRSWGDFWALPLLRAAAAAGVTTMLGGDGGDELFAVRAYLLADRLREGRATGAISLVKRLPGARAGPRRAELARMVYELAVLGALPHALHRPLRRTRLAPGPPAWLRQACARDLLDSSDRSAWKRLDGPRWWAHAAHGLTRGIEESGIFEHHRRRSELAGVETRLPLLDLDLVELGLRLPPLASFDPDRNRPLLRSAMAGRLPDAVRQRPAKALFDALLVDCLSGSDHAAVRGLLCDPRAELGAFVDLSKLRRTLFDDTRFKRDAPFQWMWHVWRLVTAECWLRSQFGGVSLPVSAARVRLGSVSSVREDSYVFPP